MPPLVRDIRRPNAYIETFLDGSAEVIYVGMIYVPVRMRGKGVGSRLVKDFIAGLDKNIKRIKLMPATLGGSDAVKFWKNQGFTDAYCGDDLYHEIKETLTLGVNGYSNPAPELVVASRNEFRHWIEEREDIIHFERYPQKVI